MHFWKLIFFPKINSVPVIFSVIFKSDTCQTPFLKGIQKIGFIYKSLSKGLEDPQTITYITKNTAVTLVKSCNEILWQCLSTTYASYSSTRRLLLQIFQPYDRHYTICQFFLCKAQYLNSIITSIAIEIHVVLYDLDDCSMLKQISKV